MRKYPEDEHERKELDELNPEPWMVEALKLNPSYVFWGPHEDYMWKKGKGWDTPIVKSTWKDYATDFCELDDLNEIVHFYFEINRDHKDCPVCGGCGVHPDAQWVEKSWYRHTSPFTLPTEQERIVQQGMHECFGSPLPVELLGRGSFPSEETFRKYKPEFRTFCEAMRAGDGYWSDKLVQEDIEALVQDHRLMDWTHEWRQGSGWTEKPGGAVANMPTAAEVNAAQHSKGMFGHDSINHHIAARARCERFGIPFYCQNCQGHGYVFTAPAAKLGLVLWVLHPRKGASRGVEIQSIEQAELPAAFALLKKAAQRNAERFEKVLQVAS